MLINFIKKVCSSRPVTVTQKVLKFPAFQFFTFTSKKFPALQFFTFTSPSHPQVNLYFFSLETKLWFNHYFLKFGAIAVGAVKFGAIIVRVSIKFSKLQFQIPPFRYEFHLSGFNFTHLRY